MISAISGRGAKQAVVPAKALRLFVRMVFRLACAVAIGAHCTPTFADGRSLKQAGDEAVDVAPPSSLLAVDQNRGSIVEGIVQQWRDSLQQTYGAAALTTHTLHAVKVLRPR